MARATTACSSYALPVLLANAIFLACAPPRVASPAPPSPSMFIPPPEVCAHLALRADERVLLHEAHVEPEGDDGVAFRESEG